MTEKLKTIKFRDHLRNFLKNKKFKAIYDTWGDAIRDEIKPRDTEISRLESELAETKRLLEIERLRSKTRGDSLMKATELIDLIKAKYTAQEAERGK